MNINENIRHNRNMVDNFRGCAYNITDISAANDSG